MITPFGSGRRKVDAAIGLSSIQNLYASEALSALLLCGFEYLNVCVEAGNFGKSWVKTFYSKTGKRTEENVFVRRKCSLASVDVMCYTWIPSSLLSTKLFALQFHCLQKRNTYLSIATHLTQFLLTRKRVYIIGIWGL